MFTPSKKQRTFDTTFVPDDVALERYLDLVDRQLELEAKEEEKNQWNRFPSFSSNSNFGSSSLQQLPELVVEAKEQIKNWFCVNTAFAKQTCMQRLPRDVENWTTSFRSGLEGGMTAEECERSCRRQPNGSSSLLPSVTNLPSSLNLVGTSATGVPGANSTILNSIIASMLPSTELSRILPTGRAVYAAINPLQQGQAYLESLLLGLTVSKSRSYVNNKYYLREILKFLNAQERTVNKFLSYSLLVKYLPQIYTSSPDRSVFFTLLNQLPRLDKFIVLATFSGLPTKELKQLIAQGTFQLTDQEIINDTPSNRQLWRLRDEIFLNWISDPEIANWFLELRHSEEQRAINNWTVWMDNFPNLFRRIARDAAERNDPLKTDLVHTFLERGYYLPLEEWKDTNTVRDALLDPLVLAIDTKDQKLIDKVAKNYETPVGIVRVRKMLATLRQTIKPEYYSDAPDLSEGEKLKLEQAIYRYNTLVSIWEGFSSEMFQTFLNIGNLL